MTADIFVRRQTHFVLWRPKNSVPPPRLIIGQFKPGNPPTLANERRFPLSPAPGFPDVFEIAAADCGLADGEIYHYWFEVEDSDPGHSPPARVRCADPFASTVDWRLRAPRVPAPYGADDRQAAAVVKFSGGQLNPVCDPGGETADFTGDPRPDTLPANNRIVIYEMPTAWSRITVPDDLDIGVGTFRDVLALVDADALGANFDDLDVTQLGRSYLTELGVNAVELLPPADSFFKREWGYDTTHFLAPDTELGFPEGFSSSTSNCDLVTLVRAFHQHGIRVFIDVVMAFARHEAYQAINFDEFYIDPSKADPADPDVHTSRGDGGLRFGFGSTLFRYAKFVNAYDPISGSEQNLVPARQLMYAYITRWMNDFHVDGIRMDTVENIANWDFIRDFTKRARDLFNNRWTAAGAPGAGDSRMLVVGEELSLPFALLNQGRLDALWNDSFRALIRAAIIGEGADGSFESTVRKAIDCRNIGFSDGAQAVNYLTSHDVEGFRKERLFNFLRSNHLSDAEIFRRAKLAFACLLTAVGVPMILAGEEFGDEHDRFDKNGNVTQSGGKQVDPVNYSRLNNGDPHNPDPLAPLRRDLLAYVSRLVKFRTAHPSLAVNDTDFIHVDFNDGKRVLVWKRGAPGADPVVIVANFSDFESAAGGGTEYVVPNWPNMPGRKWKEVSQNRSVPNEWIGREPLFRWEAKVYTLV